MISNVARLAVCLILFSLVFSLAEPSSAQDSAADSTMDRVARESETFSESPFTGEVLPVLYVHDVLRSVTYYVDTLGFVCHHFFDHISGGSTYEWTYDEPPIYAEMRAGDQKFALHRASQPESLSVSGTRHYFSVADVREHYRLIKGLGLEVGELIERPWMHMFHIEDPDGHEVYIFTRPEDMTSEE